MRGITGQILALGPCIVDTNILVSKNPKIYVTLNSNTKICVTPNANPQRKQVVYKSCWVPDAKFSRWACTFHPFCVDFIRVRSRFSLEYRLNYDMADIFNKL